MSQIGEKVTVSVQSIDLKDIPAGLGQINQQCLIFYGEQQFETEIKYESGQSTDFAEESFDIEISKEDFLLFEIWSKDSHLNGEEQDVFFGSCVITIDQLKVASGVEEHAMLLKDNAVVGSIVVKSSILIEQEPEDEFDVLEFIKEKPAPEVIFEPVIDHQLFQSRSRSTLNPMIIPMDPMADMEQSIAAAQESESTMREQIMKAIIQKDVDNKSSMADSQTQSMMFQQLYGVQQPFWINQDPSQRPVTPEQSASRKTS